MGVICLTPLNGAQLWIQTVGGSAQNKVCSLFLFKKSLRIQIDHVLPWFEDLQLLVYDFIMLQAKSFLDFQSSHSGEREISRCQWKYSLASSCNFKALWRWFFLLLIQVTQHNRMIVWAESFIISREKTRHETFSLKQMSVEGKPSLSALLHGSAIFLSQQNCRKKVWLLLHESSKQTLLHRHLFMPDTINNFQIIRKLLKSTRSAKKLSLGMFYCFLRSGWPCTYWKW